MHQIFLGFDVILSFFRGPLKHDFESNKLKNVAWKYFKCLFWIDLLSVLPLELINSSFFILKLFRFTTLMRCTATIERGITYVRLSLT